MIKKPSTYTIETRIRRLLGLYTIWCLPIRSRRWFSIGDGATIAEWESWLSRVFRMLVKNLIQKLEDGRELAFEASHERAEFLLTLWAGKRMTGEKEVTVEIRQADSADAVLSRFFKSLKESDYMTLDWKLACLQQTWTNFWWCKRWRKTCL